MDRSICVDAPSKLNLFFAVGPVRSDGFHEVSSVTVLLDLCDRLEFAPGPGVTTLVIETEPASLLKKPLETDERNLVLRAVRLFETTVGREACVSIRLVKRIPTEAGLGGGSGDAAATLVALDRMYETRLGRERLLAMAARLGSDVPLFLRGVYAYGEGRGDRVVSLDLPEKKVPKLYFVLVKPQEGLATPAVFRQFDAMPNRPPFDSARFIQTLRTGDPDAIGMYCYNALESPAESLMPSLKDLLRAMRTSGVSTARMTGSGSCCFALCRSGSDAIAVERGLAKRFPECFVRRAASAEPTAVCDDAISF